MTTAFYPPGPKDKFLVGNSIAFLRNPINFLLDVAREHGDIAYFRLGTKNAFLLNHPDYIEGVLVTHHRNFEKGPAVRSTKQLLGEGLITSDSELHRRQRRLVQPAFHRQRIASYGVVMTDYAEKMREGWQDGTTLDIAHEMMRLTLSIVGKTLFGADVESEAEEISEVWAVEDWLRGIVLNFLPFSELLAKLPIPSFRRFHKSRSRLDAIIYRMINERRARGEDQGDLLSMLLLAQDVEGDGGGMTDVQVRDEVVTIILAGHETMANALTWTWYLISQYPEVEDKLHAELDTVLGCRLPTVDDLAQLRYTSMVFAESMRLYPPVWTIGRRSINDYKIDSYLIPADSVVIMSQYVTHHDPRYYPDPFRFDPLRWIPEAQASRPKFAYFPFGGGPRLCIGEQYAWMEGVLVIATLSQKWRMRVAPGHPVVPQPLITLRPRYGMRMTIEMRK